MACCYQQGVSSLGKQSSLEVIFFFSQMSIFNSVSEKDVTSLFLIWIRKHDIERLAFLKMQKKKKKVNNLLQVLR